MDTLVQKVTVVGASIALGLGGFAFGLGLATPQPAMSQSANCEHTTCFPEPGMCQWYGGHECEWEGNMCYERDCQTVE